MAIIVLRPVSEIREGACVDVTRDGRYLGTVCTELRGGGWCLWHPVRGWFERHLRTRDEAITRLLAVAE